ncbi:MAG: decaprenyl-phosphate phosphoribosyltransferase [Sandaracinus sp.]|nr:decaprenyl-phosphate phosphoribosyltransferase [Sandaracinus sp.]
MKRDPRPHHPGSIDRHWRAEGCDSLASEPSRPNAFPSEPGPRRHVAQTRPPSPRRRGPWPAIGGSEALREHAKIGRTPRHTARVPAARARNGPSARSPASVAPIMFAGMLKAMRPHQWVKNGFVLAPLVFAKGLGDGPLVLRSAAAFLCFSFVASAIYVMNDLADVEADRLHPKKRNRPIASGRVSESVAKKMVFVLAALALVGSALLNWAAFAAIASYLVLQIAYTFKLKKIAYVDVLCIAAGFELRVLCGSFALDVQPSIYLLVVTLLLSSFLGFGKRMHELRQTEGSEVAEKQRFALTRYSERTLVALLQLTALATTGTYVVYTLDPDTRAFFGTDYLAATIVFTEFGVLRFLDLVRNKSDADSPTEQMLKDWPFLLNLVFWAIAVVTVLYVT